MSETVNICACGCNGTTRGGIFMPGHDARLRSQIEHSVGGLLALDELVQLLVEHRKGNLTLEELSRGVMRLIPQQ